jgi:NADPH-dependent 2,4-dienoyl-CoA reductase/sulfur reductase-like enzyme
MTGIIYDIAVIGGGPAGMASVQVATSSGASAVLIDDADALGGHYYKELPSSCKYSEMKRQTKKERQFHQLKQLISQCGAQTILGARVWGIFDGSGATFDGHSSSPEIGFKLYLENTSGENQEIHARTLILAPGVYDRPLPFPGWELPGVLTPGAVQNLLEKQGLLPGKRVLVAGSGPLQMVVAAALIRHGAKVVALLDSCSALDGMTDLPSALSGLWSRVGEGLDSMSALLRHRVPLMFRHAIYRAIGTDETGVQAAVIGKVDARGHPIPGTEREVQADTICCAYGFVPSIAMTLHLGIKHHFDENLSAFVPDFDQHMQTSLAGVYVAGDVTGVGGKPLAELQGQIAAYSALEKIGKISNQQAACHYSRLNSPLQREKRFARFLWKRYRLRPGLLELADDDTLFCFCEAVTLGALRECLKDGGCDLYGVKLRTRLGMGNCQGRYCIPNAALLIASYGGKPVAQLDLPSIRPPIIPVRMDDIAAFNLPPEIE